MPGISRQIRSPKKCDPSVSIRQCKLFWRRPNGNRRRFEWPIGFHGFDLIPVPTEWQLEKSGAGRWRRVLVARVTSAFIRFRRDKSCSPDESGGARLLTSRRRFALSRRGRLAGTLAPPSREDCPLHPNLVLLPSQNEVKPSQLAELASQVGGCPPQVGTSSTSP
jgi:hypothetical protein